MFRLCQYKKFIYLLTSTDVCNFSKISWNSALFTEIEATGEFFLILFLSANLQVVYPHLGFPLVLFHCDFIFGHLLRAQIMLLPHSEF